MKKTVRIVQILLGAVFLIFGINGFIYFIPAPEPFHPFMKILHSSGYLYVVKAIEILGGLSLLTQKKVILGLTLLGPVVVNIFLYHLLLDSRGLAVGAAVFILYWFLVFANWNRFKPLLKG